MNSLTDKIFPYTARSTWRYLGQYWRIARNWGWWGKFPGFSGLHCLMVWEKETRIRYFAVIMKLCMWSCCQQTIVPSDMQNSARFLQLHFTHSPPYQKGNTILGTTKTSKEVTLEEMHWSPAQAWDNGKLTNAVKSLTNGHSKKQTPLVNRHILFPRITVHESKSYVWLLKKRTPLSN